MNACRVENKILWENLRNIVPGQVLALCDWRNIVGRPEFSLYLLEHSGDNLYRWQLEQCRPFLYMPEKW